jgi:uncharacterized protein DUF4440
MKTWCIASCLLTLGLAAQLSRAESPPEPSAAELQRTVAALDTRLFAAYNHCDLETLAALVAEDLEFYHDKTGLSRGRAPFIAAIKSNICGKVHRDLVAGSLEVYPLHGYGAVEIGTHVFCDPRQCAMPPRAVWPSSSCCGRTPVAPGRSRASSATTTFQTGSARKSPSRRAPATPRLAA